MYMTVLAGAPCAKTVSFFRNLPTFLPRPAESRNNFTSKAGLLEIALLGERGTLRDIRLGADDAMGQNSMEPDPADCTILNSQVPGWHSIHSLKRNSNKILRIQWIGVTPSGPGDLSATTCELLIHTQCKFPFAPGTFRTNRTTRNCLSGLRTPRDPQRSRCRELLLLCSRRLSFSFLLKLFTADRA